MRDVYVTTIGKVHRQHRPRDVTISTFPDKHIMECMLTHQTKYATQINRVHIVPVSLDILLYGLCFVTGGYLPIRGSSGKISAFRILYFP